MDSQLLVLSLMLSCYPFLCMWCLFLQVSLGLSSLLSLLFGFLSPHPIKRSGLWPRSSMPLKSFQLCSLYRLGKCSLMQSFIISPWYACTFFPLSHSLSRVLVSRKHRATTHTTHLSLRWVSNTGGGKMTFIDCLQWIYHMVIQIKFLNKQRKHHE